MHFGCNRDYFDYLEQKNAQINWGKCWLDNRVANQGKKTMS